MNNYNFYNNDNLLVGEMGSIYKYLGNNSLISDYYLNVVNGYHISYLRHIGINNITLSIENNVDSISNIISSVGNSGLEVLVYGKVEAMIMKYCPLKMLVNNDKTPCNVCRNGKKYELKDRNGERYPLIQDKELTHIFYYRNVELEDRLNDLVKCGVLRYRFEFFDEDSSQIKSILKKYKSILLQIN